MTTVTGTDDGGSDIISYSLEWDAGTLGTVYYVLNGYTSDNFVLTNT
jgi:hypothetical protein